MNRRRAVVAGCAALILGFVALAYLRSDSALDIAQDTLGDSCGEVVEGWQVAMAAVIEGDTTTSESECRSALLRASVAAGLPETEVESVLDQGHGTVVSGGVRLTIDVYEVRLEADRRLMVSAIELADCSRTIAPLDPDAWSSGIPWDRVWYSPCDVEFHVEGDAVLR